MAASDFPSTPFFSSPGYMGFGQQPSGGTWWSQGSDAYGSKPGVPSPTQTAGQAISGNVGNLAGIYGLGGGLNQFQAAQAASQIGQNLPGYQQMVGTSSGNIQQLLQGQVPSDVVNQIIQGAAERGIMTGSPGSPNANTALLRALGLTSLGLQQQGETELTGAIQRTPTGGLFNTSSMLVTPEQQQAAGAAGALYAAGPNPAAAAAASLGTAQAGFRAGLGSVGPVSTYNPFATGYGGPMQTQYGDSGLGLTYGGISYPAGTTPTQPTQPAQSMAAIAPGQYGIGAGEDLLGMPQLSSVWGGGSQGDLTSGGLLGDEFSGNF